jgi:hypothetical protein
LTAGSLVKHDRPCVPVDQILLTMYVCMYIYIFIYIIWVNYNISLTWNKAIESSRETQSSMSTCYWEHGWFPHSQLGHLPQLICGLLSYHVWVTKSLCLSYIRNIPEYRRIINL